MESETSHAKTESGTPGSRRRRGRDHRARGRRAQRERARLDHVAAEPAGPLREGHDVLRLRLDQVRAPVRRGAQGLDAVFGRQRLQHPRRREQALAAHADRHVGHVPVEAHRGAQHEHVGVLRRRRAVQDVQPERRAAAQQHLPHPDGPARGQPHDPRALERVEHGQRVLQLRRPEDRQRRDRPGQPGNPGNPGNPGTCSAPAWSASAAYVGGANVSYSGRNYQAKWWTTGENPSQSGQWGVWKDLGAC